jgi:hypothetical protein
MVSGKAPGGPQVVRTRGWPSGFSPRPPDAAQGEAGRTRRRCESMSSLPGETQQRGVKRYQRKNGCVASDAIHDALVPGRNQRRYTRWRDAFAHPRSSPAAVPGGRRNGKPILQPAIPWYGFALPKPPSRAEPSVVRKTVCSRQSPFVASSRAVERLDSSRRVGRGPPKRPTSIDRFAENGRRLYLGQ